MRMNLWVYAALLPCLVGAMPAAAQDIRDEESLGVYHAEPPDQIDIRVEIPRDEPTQAQLERCREEQQAASIRDEILVCGESLDQSQYRTTSRENSQRRYAEETNTQGFLGAPDFNPDVAGPGIFRGKPTVSGLCLPLSCPSPLPLFIDVAALPEAPAGSDADRIARGLAPIGNDTGTIAEPVDIDTESPAPPAPPAPPE